MSSFGQHPSLRRALKGVSIGLSPASPPAAASMARPPEPEKPIQRENSRGGLIDELPGYKLHVCGFSRIEIPVDFVTGPTDAMWVLLGRIKPQRGEELLLNQVDITMAPPDTQGSGVIDPQTVSWSNALGTGATIVMTQPSEAQTDTYAGRFLRRRFNYPGFWTNSSDPMLDTFFGEMGDGSPYLHIADWCPGRVNSDPVNKWVQSKHLGALGHRVSAQDYIDVFAVFRPGTPDFGDTSSERFIYGHCVVKTILATTRARGQFNRD